MSNKVNFEIKENEIQSKNRFIVFFDKSTDANYIANFFNDKVKQNFD